MLSVICVLLIIVAILGIILYKKQTEYRQASENNYNQAFYEVVNYVQNVETYLAKSMISSTPEHGAETVHNIRQLYSGELLSHPTKWFASILKGLLHICEPN